MTDDHHDNNEDSEASRSRNLEVSRLRFPEAGWEGPQESRGEWERGDGGGAGERKEHLIIYLV